MTDVCPWAAKDPLLRAYHDAEWGVPVRDDRALFAKLVLDGFQAGLSWLTILRKREAFERVFEGFDPERLAAWDEARVAVALADPGIVRNRQKVRAAVTNAQAFVRLGGGFSDLLWGFTGGAPIVNRHAAPGDVPAETPESRAMSKALIQRGFRFAGPTIVYAFMQAVGMVNDHLVTCPRHAALASRA
jgi:DNA-3-methyladenine glycosylase I